MEQQLLHDVQQNVDEILSVLDRVCREQDIPYYLFYGSELGAVRHSGFIPWDDDADVVMFRADYEKLRSWWIQNPVEGYFFQDTQTDPGYRMKITKIRKNNTAFVEPRMQHWDCHHGMFVDIFVLDDYVKNPLLRRIGELITMFDFNASRQYKPDGAAHRILYGITNRVFRGGGIFRWWYGKVFPKLRKDPNMCSDIASFTFKKQYNFRREWLGTPKRLPYDGMMLCCPADTDATLRVCYGDYMTPPPLEKQVSNHPLVYVSTEREYHPGMNIGKEADHG